jgi:hypothetical protein
MRQADRSQRIQFARIPTQPFSCGFDDFALGAVARVTQDAVVLVREQRFQLCMNLL